VTIRARAFVVLWLIAVLVLGTIGFIVLSLNIASAQDEHRDQPEDNERAGADGH
jgi:hypothetical protein